MPLDHSMISSSVRIIGDVADKRTVIGQRRAPIGTGFLIGVPSVSQPAVRYGYVATAHHVIEDQNHVEVQVPNPLAVGELYEPEPVTDWRQPLDKVDFALAPFNGSKNGVYSGLYVDTHFSPANFEPPLAATIYYVGILVPLDRPMARSGILGAVNQTGIPHIGDYQYTAHLVDCRSYGGFSGSPCFVEYEVPVLTPERRTPFPLPPIDDPNESRGSIEYYSMVCGMFTEHLTDHDEGMASRYGVGVMLPSREIWRALMTDKMKDERAEWDAQNKAAEKGAGPKLTGASTGGPTDPFERFEDLTRKLVNTPKSEIDERRKADQ